MKTLTVTEAAKKFTNCIERVYYQHESFELLKNGVPRARLVPASRHGCNTHELADDLAHTQLLLEDRRSLGSAVRKGRRQLKPLSSSMLLD